MENHIHKILWHTLMQLLCFILYFIVVTFFIVPSLLIRFYHVYTCIEKNQYNSGFSPGINFMSKDGQEICTPWLGKTTFFFWNINQHSGNLHTKTYYYLWMLGCSSGSFLVNSFNLNSFPLSMFWLWAFYLSFILYILFSCCLHGWLIGGCLGSDPGCLLIFLPCSLFSLIFLD